MKTSLLAAVATLGIIFQNVLEIHGWIFYLTFTAYLLLVKDKGDAIKLTCSFLLGIVLSVLIWEMTGLFMIWTGSLGIGMSIAAFAGILVVLYLKRFKPLNMSPAFFYGLIAYYGVAQPPSWNIIAQVIVPALIGIVVAYLYVALERLLEKDHSSVG